MAQDPGRHLGDHLPVFGRVDEIAPLVRILDAVEEHGDRLVRGAAFERDEAGDGGGIRRECGEAVDGVRGDGGDAARADRRDDFVELLRREDRQVGAPSVRCDYRLNLAR